VTGTLKLRGEVSRVDARTWRGQVRGPGGAVGDLVITGALRFSAHCCQFPARTPETTLRYRWTTASGSLSRCVQARVMRRPHGRWVWDGPGRATAATGSLRGYAGRQGAFGGHTSVAAPDRTLIVIEAWPPGGSDNRSPANCR
jgi:hypothetical protein